MKSFDFRQPFCRLNSERIQLSSNQV